MIDTYEKLQYEVCFKCIRSVFVKTLMSNILNLVDFLIRVIEETSQRSLFHFQ